MYRFVSRLFDVLRTSMAVMLLVLAVPAFAAAAEMTGTGGSVYWSNSVGGVIASAALDGSGGGNFAPSGATVSTPSGIAIDALAGQIYWANRGNNSIAWARLNGPGGTLTTTGATVDHPGGLAIDPATAKRVYWTNAAGGPGGNGTISWAALSGANTGGGDLITGPDVNAPDGVAVDPAHNMIYWTNSVGSGPGPGPGSVMSAQADGSGATPLAITGVTIDSPAGLALDPLTDTLYWANSPAGDSGSISYWNVVTGSGGSLVTAAPIDHPEGIAIDPVGGRLYWANAGDDTIGYANLDGSGGGTLATAGATVSGPSFPILIAVPAGTGIPVISGAHKVGATLTCEAATWASDLLPAFYYRAARNITLQWSRDGVDIAGATSTTYSATAVGSYVCRSMAKNHAGTTTQTSGSFTVSDVPATVTRPASSLSATAATLNGTINPAYAATSYHFEYGTTELYGSRVPASDVAVGADGAVHAVGQSVSGLQPNRTYHFRLVATNENGTTYGADEALTTSTSPAVATGSAVKIAETGAVLEGTINPQNLLARYYFEFGPTARYGSRVPASDATVAADASGHLVREGIAGLSPATTYHFRLVVVSAQGTTSGADRTFRTLAEPRVEIIGRVGTVGPELRATLACTGVAGQRCDATLSVRVVEKLSPDRKRIVGVSATPIHGPSRTVVAGQRAISLAAGRREAVTLRLNATGRKLRDRFTNVPAAVELGVARNGRQKTLRTVRVVFGAAPPSVRIVGLSVRGSAVTAQLRCTGARRARCTGELTLTTFERLGADGRTVAGLSGHPAGAGKWAVVGRVGYSTPSGRILRRTVVLSPAGRALLSRFGRLPAVVTTTVSYRGYVLTMPSRIVNIVR